jgi:uncharacterized membrane protein
MTSGKESAMTIRNPIEWSGAQLVSAAHAAERVHRSLHHISETIHSPMPVTRRIGTEDVWRSLGQGVGDFEAYRSDVIFLCATYALVGLVIARLALGGNLLPLLFPLASGFAIIGPLAAVGLYEMSRRREQGASVSWINAFDVLKAPAIGQIAVLGLVLIAVFLTWLGAAWLIFDHTLGPNIPTAPGPFLHSVFFTSAGRIMLVAGIAVGFCFALLAMMLSVVAFPLLVDRDIGLDTAIKTSFRAVIENPKPMALWGALVAAILALGTAFVFVGLMVAVPVLGHATWHLYRKLVIPA